MHPCPWGSLAVKKVKGKEYYYHRFTSAGKRSENYVDFQSAEEFRSQIEKRKALEAELKTLKKFIPAPKSTRMRNTSHEFKTYVRIGNQLRNWAAPVKKNNHRECYADLREFVFGEQQDKVFILYGLRRTGKTTLIRQLILDMNPAQLEQAAFIQVKARDTLSAINSDLKYPQPAGDCP